MRGMREFLRTWIVLSWRDACAGVIVLDAVQQQRFKAYDTFIVGNVDGFKTYKVNADNITAKLIDKGSST